MGPSSRAENAWMTESKGTISAPTQLSAFCTCLYEGAAQPLPLRLIQIHIFSCLGKRLAFLKPTKNMARMLKHTEVFLCFY